MIIYQIIALQVTSTLLFPTVCVAASHGLVTSSLLSFSSRQCLYYLVEGGILMGFNLVFGLDVSLAQIFTPRGLEIESAEGLLNVLALLLSFVAGYGGRNERVGKRRLSSVLLGYNSQPLKSGLL
jgi:hypothetical protein